MIHLPVLPQARTRLGDHTTTTPPVSMCRRPNRPGSAAAAGWGSVGVCRALWAGVIFGSPSGGIAPV